MKIAFLLLLVLSVSCNQSKPEMSSSQIQIDSLKKKLNNSYKPGLGEFMMAIQIHHAKLWFAGQSGNWGLSDFETKEIRESIEDIENYCSDRTEVASLPMINSPLDSIEKAITHKNINQFKKGFIFLTNTCNNCHRVTKHEFNVIKIPETPPFTNQSYKIESDAEGHKKIQ